MIEAIILSPCSQTRRAIRFHIEAFDINCRQHIQPPFTQDEVVALMQPLSDRLSELEAENDLLKRSAAARMR